MVQAASHGGGGGGKAPKTDVAVGGFYQISHVNLPPRTPSWLKSIQVVMVSEKNRFKVTVRFPSRESLDNFLCKSKPCFYPNLDMCFIMGMKLAQRVLIRQVTCPDFDNTEELKSFWMVNVPLVPKLELDEVSGKHLSSSTIDSEDEKVDEIDNKQALAIVVKEEKVDDTADENQKRKKYKWWSSESFATGEKVILKILKEKKAGADNPIYRAALRKEAQKEIGNTGLLDHLLKDIPGRVAPDGISRFQRCYNATGVIMYWLESADLVDIRKKAGVADPYWIPPPGWKQGGCSAGCPCADELEVLKEDLSKVKRELEETKKQLNEVRNAADIRRCCDCSKWVGGFW
ncbi:hypothetical protein M9H77_10859 [Catharanthus roseus]|uniref:Uncharacterized protein n=1 Tax=Catharanthus roseus TaxID=4058 RepID=A0ACC0BCZ1_CATRO|nr:hypothetical protein M9H77_10859 [Catharanthus roseus]